jgi:pimeloyl-ACP methyl ester carboxylesterase
VAVARPALVSALVLVSPPLPGHEWSPEVQAFGDAEDDALERGDVDAAVELNLQMWFDGQGRRSAVIDPARRASVGAMQRWAFELQLAGEGAEEELLVPDLSERIAEITAPTLIVVGEHDASDFHAIGARLAATLPHAQLNVLPGTAHIPNYERPELFDPLLAGTLN